MSISDKQLEANRANSQKSTGPKTDEGKTRSCMNARKHGFTGHATIMTDEDYEAQQEFIHPYVESFNPVGPAEIQLARTVALDNFRLNRLKAVEENTLSHGETRESCDFEAEDPRIHHAVAQAKVFSYDSKTLDRLSLYEQRITRNIHRNTKLLWEMQDRRKAEEEYKARLEAKAKPLTLTGPLYGDLSRTASTTNETNGFDFSSELSKAADAPETTRGAESDAKKAA